MMISKTMKTARRATTEELELLELDGSSLSVSEQKQSMSVVMPDGNSSLNAGFKRRNSKRKMKERERERERES